MDESFTGLKGASDQFMNQHLIVKIHQLIVANLANRLTISCNWRLDLAHFNFTSE
jgi:hypothetical protein